MNEVKNLEQIKVVENYIREGPDRSTIVFATGVGKSKIVIDILKHKLPKKVLLLVNSTVLRDENWKEEFQKWNFIDYYEECVEIQTYQLVYKWKAEEKDLTDYFIIADEVDFAANVPELSKFFYEYLEIPILGLTGFITESKLDWFYHNLPVFAELTADEAQEKGILNSIHFVFVKYDLSKNPKDILVEYTAHGEPKSFRQSENAAYDYAHKQYISAIITKETNNDAFMKQEISYEQYLKELNSADYRIKMAVKDRSEVLLHSISSKAMTKKLITYIQKQNTDDKIIVFSKRTSQSLDICGEDKVYNGSVTKSTADENFKNFKSGEIKLLGVCDKVNRGVNIENLNVAILESFYGSDTKAIQRFGRMMRLDPGKMATVYILLPYFMRKTTKKNKETGEKDTVYVLSETQQVVWAAKMLRSTNIKSKAVWDYRMVKDET